MVMICNWFNIEEFVFDSIVIIELIVYDCLFMLLVGFDVKGN